MLPFPKTRREIKPYLAALVSGGKRFVIRNRNAVIGVTSVLMIGVVISAFAFSDGGKRPSHKSMVPYSAKPSGIAGKPHLVKKTAVKTTAVGGAGITLAAGRKLYDAKKYEQAIDVFQPLVDENVEARFWLGKAHLAEGNDFRGCRQLNKYVELAPKGRYVKAAKTSLQKC